MKVLLIGTGYMAREYSKVLKDLDIEFEVVGRGEANCKSYKELFPNVNIFSGGVESFKFNGQYTHCLICSNVDYLARHTRLIIDLGIKNILVEKPGGANQKEISDLAFYSIKNNARVAIGYNRRFYTSVIKCKELVQEDGGVKSFHFEFTEWPHTFEHFENYKLVRNNLLFANSTHLIDMAFFIGGIPREMKSFSIDKLNWHPKAIYSGAGITNSNALFSYQANWKGPGRWSADFITEKRRYIFKPLEFLQVQDLKSLKVEQLSINDELDIQYKHGLYKQVSAFLFKPEHPSLIYIEQQDLNCKNIYQVILDGN